MVAAAVGFFMNSGVTGLYGLFALRFPAEVRTTGTGFVTAVGRGGSALAPAVAGLLFAADYGLQSVAFIMASGSVIALFALLVLKSGTSSKGQTDGESIPT